MASYFTASGSLRPPAAGGQPPAVPKASCGARHSGRQLLTGAGLEAYVPAAARGPPAGGDGGYYSLPRNDLSVARDGSAPRKTGVKGIPFRASGIPFTASGIPFGASGIPFTASGIPFGASGIPFTTKGIPFTTKGIPFRTKGIPFRTKGIPFTTKGIPFTAKGIPFMTKGIPFGTV
ncbi:MAG: hypothetical protein LBD24_06820 [Spirochaetaceae bacterium]|nr:hypothetical protein [Spirochaetaceae bacterium]